jgi:plastocyanin
MDDRKRGWMLALVLAVVLAGCAGDDGAGVRDVGGLGTGPGHASASGSASASGPATGTASAAVATCKPVGDPKAAGARVRVELGEWFVRPAEPGVQAGTVTFEAVNKGADAHELVVVRADDPDRLPVGGDGTVDEAKLPKGALVGEIEAFPAGQSCTGTFDLKPGTYAFFCNLLEQEAGKAENHYALGMRTSFQVR